MLAIRGAKVLTACGPGGPLAPAIVRGVVLVDNGKIQAVAGQDLPVPRGCEVLDASGCIVTPGFIDAHSHIGVYEDGVGWEGNDANEHTDPNTADVRALDGINPADTAFAEALEGGVTTVQVDPGSANIIGGEIVTIKCAGAVVDEMVLLRPSGLKAALGENPKRAYGSQRKRPATRMGNAAVLRAALIKAQDYVRKQEAAAGKPDKQADVDLRLEMIAKVLRHEIPLRIHAHRADDILTAVRVKDEFGIDISIEHTTEGHKVADILAAKGIPCTLGPLARPRTKLETRDKGPHVPAALAAAGVKIAIITDHPVIPQQWLRITAGLAIRGGLPEETALAACTRNAAEIIGVAGRVGTLEPGKDADIVVWDGDPFEFMTKARCVLVNGRVAYCRCAKPCSDAGAARGCCSC